MKEHMVHAPIDRVTTLVDGSKVIPHEPQQHPLLYFPVSKSSTSYHESVHSVVSEEVHEYSVDMTSRKAGSNYAGITYINHMSAIAAIAPHADGCDGTGHDMRVVEHLGANHTAAASDAKRIIANNVLEIAAVTHALDAKGTLTGNEVRTIIAEVRREPEVVYSVISPTGREEIFTQVPEGKLITLFEREESLAA